MRGFLIHDRQSIESAHFLYYRLNFNIKFFCYAFLAFLRTQNLTLKLGGLSLIFIFASEYVHICMHVCRACMSA